MAKYSKRAKNVKKTKKPAKKGNDMITRSRTAASTTSTQPNSNNKRTRSSATAGPVPKKIKGSYMQGSSALLSPLDSTSYLPSVRTAEYNMKDIAGLDKVKEKLIDSIVDRFVLDEKRKKIVNMVQPRGLLLTGPPGCGKTILADAIVNAIKEKGKDVNFYQETGSCLSQWLGETERNLRSLFAFAHANSPAVIFLDEVDGLGLKRENRHNSGNTIITTLLTEINNVSRGQVLLIAATNCIDQVDQALIRPGRFDVSLEVPLPNDQGRTQILQHYIAKKKLQIRAPDIQRIVKETENWSGAKLETFVDNLHGSRWKKVCPDYLTASESRLKAIMPKVLQVEPQEILDLLALMDQN